MKARPSTILAIACVWLLKWLLLRLDNLVPWRWLTRQLTTLDYHIAGLALWCHRHEEQRHVR